jgi:hypothetical protein
LPFGGQADGAGSTLHFDEVYEQLVEPAIVQADLQPVRADHESGDWLCQDLLLYDFCVVDVSTATAEIYYRLGLRHAIRPKCTVQIFAEGKPVPFCREQSPCLPYTVDQSGQPGNPVLFRDQLAELIREARAAHRESPVSYLLRDIWQSEIKRLKTDVFRERVHYDLGIKERLAEARAKGPEAVKAVKEALEPIREAEPGAVIDLMLSFRAVKAWNEVVALCEEMSLELRRTVMVREQLAFALNRAGFGERAEVVLLEVIAEHGPSSETNSILGRVFKDRWMKARSEGDQGLAEGLLDLAIHTYLEGFEADWRDAFPGINAVNLMEFREPPDPRRFELVPVVTYAVKRRMAAGESDYWDHATLLELAVLGSDMEAARQALNAALAEVREEWEPESTLRTLRLIRETRVARGDNVEWLQEIEAGLAAAVP